MNIVNVQESVSVTSAERKVLEYLQTHPDIFVRHAPLLAELEVPHACGRAVSLIEHQVAVLRDQNRQLKRRLHELVDNARENEDLSQRLHRLTLTLIQCQDLGEVFAALHEALRESFAADRVALRLFVEPTPALLLGGEELVGDAQDVRRPFANVLAGRKPVCGRLRDEQRAALFDDEQDIVSGALMPLGVVELFGLLAVGSRDEHRFHAGMGTVFLRQLAEVASEVIGAHLAAVTRPGRV